MVTTTMDVYEHEGRAGVASTTPRGYVPTSATCNYRCNNLATSEVWCDTNGEYVYICGDCKAAGMHRREDDAEYIEQFYAVYDPRDPRGVL